MSNDLTTSTLPDAATMESLIIGGDLSKLSPAQRVSYYQAVCKSLGLNQLTKPFDYIQLNGRLTLYARKDATDQIRKNYNVSVPKLDKETLNGIYIVTAYAEMPNGRKDTSTGAVYVESLKGENLANAMMKAETKAKRRVTLSICGLGMLDETEVETIPTAKPVIVAETGEILEAKAVEAPIQPISDNPLIPAALAHLEGICTSEGTPYPLLSLEELTTRYNSLVKSLKENGLSPEVKAEKTRKRDAAQECIEYKRTH